MVKPLRSLMLMLALTCFAGATFTSAEASAAEVTQQNGTARGVVRDAQGPVIGAGVVVKGSPNKGTITSPDGSFELKDVARGATLVISCIGYNDAEVVWNGQALNVTLQESSTILDETVVVGYAVQKKANLTGAVSTVNVEKDINNRTTNTISNLLAGAAPGLLSIANSSSGSRPGANSAALRIRGTGTTNDASPLVIVDGVVASMDNVNPADVENISILKDAASAAIYGSRAANGVILVTTKKGSRTGKPTVTFNGLYSLESVYKAADYFNIESNYADYMEWLNLACTNAGAKTYFSPEKIAEWRAHENDKDPRSKLFWPNTDWTKDFFRLAKVHNHTVSVSGGSDRVRYYVSGNFYLNPGVIQWTDYKKFSITANIDIDVTKFLTLGLNVRGYRSEMDPCSDVASADGDAITYGAAAGSPGVVLKSPDGRYGEFNNGEDNMAIVNANAFRRLNFFAHDRPDVTHSLIPRFSAKVTPFKGMEIEGSYTYNFRNLMIDHLLQDMDLWRWVYNPNGTTEAEKYQEIRDLKTVNVYDLKRTYYYYYQTADLVARYNTEIGDLKLGGVLGTSGEYYKSDIWGSVKFNNESLAAGEHNDYRLAEWSSMVTNTATAASVANNTVGTVSEWAMRSYFGRINLNWKDKYLLEGNLRADGSSRFAPENRWGWFPSVSAGWVISEEGFFHKSDFVNFLKIRASWGSLGNNAIGNYDWQSLYSASNYVLNNGSTTAGLALNSISNRAITWEKTTVTNIGVDFNLLSNRLTGTAEVYDKTTDGILLSVPASLTNGTVTIPKQNAAVVQNRGVELQLSWRDRVGEFGYNVTGNVAYNKNKVIDYATPSISTYTIEEGQPLNYLNIFLVDRMIRNDEDVAYVEDLVKQYPDMFKSWAKPEKGDLLYKDVNGDGTLNADDRYKQSKGNMPVWSFGLSLGADWKGFDFSMIFNGVADWKDILMDNLVWNPSPRYGYSLNKTIKDGAFQDGVNNETAKFPRPLIYTSDKTRNRRLSSFWVYDRAYLRLKNVQLGYTVPVNLTRKFSVDRLRVFTSVDNAFTLTEWPGFDPEIARGRAKMNHPTTRVVTFGVNITL